MIFDLVNESFDTLGGFWRELAGTFRLLGESLGATDPKRPFLVEPAQGTIDPRSIPQFCDHEATDRSRGERQRIDAFRNALQASFPARDLLDRAIDVFNESERRTKFVEDNSNYQGRSQIQAWFKLEYGTDETKDNPEEAACRDQLNELGRFIQQSLSRFRDLQAKEAGRESLQGIRSSVNSLSAFPILTADLGFPGSGGGGAAPSYGQSGASSLARTVDVTLREVLGRSPKLDDTRSFLAALNASFEVREVQGHTEVTWTPRSFAGQTDLGGGVTGGQASLYLRAKVAMENALPLLAGLYPLREDDDDELTEAARHVVRSTIEELVTELGQEGGPRIARVDNLFGILFDQSFTIIKDDGTTEDVEGQFAVLQHEFGLSTQLVNTLEEEVNLTNYTALNDYVTSIRTSWENFRNTLLGKDLGTRLVLLSRALTVVSEAVREVTSAMDSVFVGASERLVATFRDSAGRRITVGELLSWVDDFAATEAPRLVNDGGRRGVEAVIPTARLLQDMVDRLVRQIPFEPELPEGLEHPRVLNPLLELVGHLKRVRRLAEEVRTQPQIPETALTVRGSGGRSFDGVPRR